MTDLKCIRCGGMSDEYCREVREVRIRGDHGLKTGTVRMYLETTRDSHICFRCLEKMSYSMSESTPESFQFLSKELAEIKELLQTRKDPE